MGAARMSLSHRVACAVLIAVSITSAAGAPLVPQHCETEKGKAPLSLNVINDYEGPIKIRVCNKYDPVSGAPCNGNPLKPNHYDDCPDGVPPNASSTFTFDADAQYLTFANGDKSVELWKPSTGGWPTTYTVKALHGENNGVPHPLANSTTAEQCRGLPAYFMNCGPYGGSATVCCDGRYAEGLRSMCSHPGAEGAICKTAQ